jgi:serine protease Do
MTRKQYKTLKNSISLGIVATFFTMLGLLFASGKEWTEASHAVGSLNALPLDAEPASIPLTVDERGSSPFVAVAERLLPSVVHIKTSTKVSPRSSRSPFGMPDFFGIPDDQFHRDLDKITGSGSGFIVDDEGYILTNNHVIEGADEITVVLSDHKEVPGEVVGTDPETDLAVVKIDKKHSAGRVAPLGKSDDVRVGDWAIAIGNPYGLEQSLTVGVISATGRANLNIAGGAPIFQNFLQTDASINFGNSGGPLVDIHGRVIGINTAINTQAQGIGFAIPMDMADKVYRDLKSRGAVTRGYLGMVPRELGAEMRMALDLDPEQTGILVDSVQEDTPAAAGGLEAGDVIASWAGSQIKDVPDFRMKVARTSPGETVKAEILRGGKKKTLSFTLADRADAIRNPGQPSIGNPVAPEDPVLGLEVAEISDELIRRFELNEELVARHGGILITSVGRESPARGKLSVGDVLYRMDRKRIANLDDFREAEKSFMDQDALLVHVIRGNRTTIEAIALKE